MIQQLAQHWWALALRGVAAILFGVLTFVVPGITLLYLVYLFAFYVIFEGVFNIVSVIRAPGHHWLLLVEGLISICAGILTILWPGITALILLYLIAFWAIFTGILEISSGIRLRQHISNEWLLILMGILSIAFGVFITVFPGAGAIAIILWIGGYAVLFGVILLVFAFRLRKYSKDAGVTGTAGPTAAHS